MQEIEGSYSSLVKQCSMDYERPKTQGHQLLHAATCSPCIVLPCPLQGVHYVYMNIHETCPEKSHTQSHSPKLKVLGLVICLNKHQVLLHVTDLPMFLVVATVSSVQYLKGNSIVPTAAGSQPILQTVWKHREASRLSGAELGFCGGG